MIIYKHTKHAINNEMKACKQYIWELEIYTKTDEATLHVSKTRWSSHQTSLESDASKKVLFKHGTHPLQGTYTLTSCESPHLHQIQEGWSLVPISYWVHGG